MRLTGCDTGKQSSFAHTQNKQHHLAACTTTGAVSHQHLHSSKKALEQVCGSEVIQDGGHVNPQGLVEVG